MDAIRSQNKNNKLQFRLFFFFFFQMFIFVSSRCSYLPALCSTLCVLISVLRLTERRCVTLSDDKVRQNVIEVERRDLNVKDTAPYPSGSKTPVRQPLRKSRHFGAGVSCWTGANFKEVWKRPHGVWEQLLTCWCTPRSALCCKLYTWSSPGATACPEREEPDRS